MSLIGAGVAILVVVTLILTAYATWRGAPWLPTPLRAVEDTLRTLRVGPADTVVDLGSGDGRVLLAAAGRGAQAVGYELSPIFWLLSWLRTRRCRDLVSVRFADGFRADLSGATVLFAFLRPPTMPTLAAALARQQRLRRCVVAAYAFPFPDRPPSRVLRSSHAAPVFLYDVGGEPSGRIV